MTVALAMPDDPKRELVRKLACLLAYEARARARGWSYRGWSEEQDSPSYFCYFGSDGEAPKGIPIEWPWHMMRQGVYYSAVIRDNEVVEFWEQDDAGQWKRIS